MRVEEITRKPCCHDAAAVLFGLKFADNIHYKSKSSQASKARLQSSEHTGTKQNLTQNGHSEKLFMVMLLVKSLVIVGKEAFKTASDLHHWLDLNKILTAYD